MLAFRHADPRFPFLWESDGQPTARWHGEGEGPVHYFANTPAGAWAELVRHEGIEAAEDLEGIQRSLWAVEIGTPPQDRPGLPDSVLRGGLATHGQCRDEARRLRDAGAIGLSTLSAALEPDGARGWVVDSGQRPGPEHEALVFVLFGSRPDVVGWRAVDGGHPPAEVLRFVRPLR